VSDQTDTDQQTEDHAAPHHIRDAFLALVNADTLGASRDIVEAHPELLTTEADVVVGGPHRSRG